MFEKLFKRTSPKCQKNEPIFIVGVPRSGTTLLRVLLDSHPNIACGPETPWLARGTHSIKGLYRFMAEDSLGYVKSYNVPQKELRKKTAEFVDGLFMAYATSKNKSRWAEKTPDHSLEIPFLADIFPNACFVHIVRDGRDVACSTSILSEERKAVSEWHSNNLLMDDGVVATNTVQNSALRWLTWLRRIERELSRVRRSYTLRYEDLVAAPEQELRRLMTFIGEEFSPTMLDYMKRKHDYPDWEWGSRDVKRSKGVSTRSVRRWEKQLEPAVITELEGLLGETLLHYGYEITKGKGYVRDAVHVPQRVCRLASVEELESERFRHFMAQMNAFADQRDLRTFTDWSKVWEYPWLWFNALEKMDWTGKTVLDLGSEISPMPWYLASLGARVTLIECDPQWISTWERLRTETGLDVDWQIVDSELLPFPDRSFDVVTSFSVIEHQPDKKRAIDEVSRVLKPGGLFALSFDICEPELGMTFPEWNGRALTMAEFEETVWSRHDFGANGAAPSWNRDDLTNFVGWHLRSAPHHNYAVGAAALEKLQL